jgi:hypothetical protein
MQGLRGWCAAALLAFSSLADAAGFGKPGGPLPRNTAEVWALLQQDAPSAELLISFGTSKGGSAGHLALALRNDGGDPTVYSANFYADRSAQHSSGFYTGELMLAIPKQEYLYGTRSSLGATASFGLDYGEVYKRSVIGVRVFGMPAAEAQALRAFFTRINTDFRKREPFTEYHDGEIRYDYLKLNCAKTIGAAFKFGAGYAQLEVNNSLPLASRLDAVAAFSANMPSDMMLALMQQWQARGYSMDSVLYRKWPRSAWIDPHDESKMRFAELPDRFPSVRSLDYGAEADAYADKDNLFMMSLPRLMGRYVLHIDPAGNELVLLRNPAPLPFAQAMPRARAEAALPGPAPRHDFAAARR